MLSQADVAMLLETVMHTDMLSASKIQHTVREGIVLFILVPSVFV